MKTFSEYLNEDWQKRSGKNEKGGLNEKGRKSTREKIQEAILKTFKKVGEPS